MARIDLIHKPVSALLCAGIAGLLFADGAVAGRDPNCLDKLKKERGRILDRFGKLQNYKTYTPAKAAKLQAEVEKYLISIGDVLKNFNVEIFFEEQLEKIPRVNALSKGRRKALVEVLRPSFESRTLPSYENLARNLKDAGLGDLPVWKIRDTMDRSFRAWRTKIVFDETGGSVYNSLAKAYVEKMGIGEFSMNLRLLGKNEWEAFFEAEKGPGIFNPSMPGMMADFFTSTEAHESVHMVVESLAAQGHDSPYAVWVKLDKRFRATGAIGDRQKAALAAASDPLSDGDYYRTELYLDEFPAHVIQGAYLNVSLSKALRKRFQEVVDGARTDAAKEELERAFAEHLRSGSVKWSGYSSETKSAFEGFLAEKASDGRTQVAKLLGEMNEYANWVDLIQDGGASSVFEARKIVDDAVLASQRDGNRNLRSKAGDLVTIHPDVFLGVPGYRIEVRVPVSTLQSDGTYRIAPNAASVNFRFIRDGKVSKTITPEKLEKLRARMDWVAELAAASKKETDRYARYLDENGELKDYTFADVFRLKFIHTRLRQLTRETLERIRASR